jgi:hypothetical protein
LLDQGNKWELEAKKASALSGVFMRMVQFGNNKINSWGNSNGIRQDHLQAVAVLA